MEWDKLASKESIERTMNSLESNGIKCYFVKNRKEAKRKALELIHEGSEIMTMSSETLKETGIADEIQKSGKYDSVRNKFEKMDRKTQSREMQRMGAAPEVSMGSFHAATEDGKIIIASATGSQLAAHVFGADRVIFVAGTQKIVKNLDDGMKRIQEYVFPLEDARARKAYGAGSGINKVLLINKEAKNDRISVIFVNEKLGF